MCSVIVMGSGGGCLAENGHLDGVLQSMTNKNESKQLYPLVFEPIYKEKVWGAALDHLLSRELPNGKPIMIGESWEVADLKQTSVSGGGGGSAHSVVKNGWLKGKNIAEVIRMFGEEFLGELSLTEDGGFPLLVKYLNSGENLSVQVHPDAEYVAEHEGTSLKDECWYILDAKEGAVIYKGVKEGVTAEQFREAIKHKTLPELLIEVPVQKGDCHYIPSGTCHALGGGVLAAEVQTPSDTTYRVYDWDRTDRELHIEKALECIKFGEPEVKAYEMAEYEEDSLLSRRKLIRCQYYKLDRLIAKTTQRFIVNRPVPTIWMVVEGSGYCDCSELGHVELKAGDTILVPPGRGEDVFTMKAKAKWIEVSFPM